MKSQGRGETLPAETGSLMAPQKGTHNLIPEAYEYVTSQGNAALQMRSRILRGEPNLDYGGGQDVIPRSLGRGRQEVQSQRDGKTLLLALKTQEGATSGGMRVACGSWGSRDGDSPESLQKGCCSADPLISAWRMDAGLLTYSPVCVPATECAVTCHSSNRKPERRPSCLRPCEHTHHLQIMETCILI